MVKRVAPLALGVLLMSGGLSHANLIAPFETQFDTDWTYAGVGGLRGTGAGDIALSGVSGTVNQAYLYWHGPTNSSDPTWNANISFDGNAISGTNIGFSDDNFWSRANSQAYRADVTSFVTGNGTYSLSGLIPNDSNGASLIVFFDDGDDTNNRDVVTFDGNDANFPNAFDPDNWDVTLNGINYTAGTATMVLSVSDGQTFSDTVLQVNGTTIDGPGAVFQGTTVPTTPGTSVTNGALWDIKSYDVTAFLTPGLNSLNMQHFSVNDALSLIHVAIDLPAGAAPPTGTVPEPASILLFGVGLGGLAAASRRRRKGKAKQA